MVRLRRALRGIHQVRGAVVDLELVQVHVVEPVALGERAGQLARVDHAVRDQRLAERQAALARAID